MTFLCMGCTFLCGGSGALQGLAGSVEIAHLGPCHTCNPRPEKVITLQQAACIQHVSVCGVHAVRPPMLSSIGMCPCAGSANFCTVLFIWPTKTLGEVAGPEAYANQPTRASNDPQELCPADTDRLRNTPYARHGWLSASWSHKQAPTAAAGNDVPFLPPKDEW